jgi:hypothetical protein
MRGWALTILVAIGLTGTARTAWAEPEDPISVGLLVVDEAGVASNVLTLARAEATRVYHAFGITLVWTEGHKGSVAYRFVVKIVSRALKGKGINGRAMGVAPGTEATRGTVAYAFYDRIQNVTQDIGADAGHILGHVIAHEIGHLLLPSGAHAKSGLMRGSWDTDQTMRAMRGTLTFTTQEAALIRRRLR